MLAFPSQNFFSIATENAVFPKNIYGKFIILCNNVKSLDVKRKYLILKYKILNIHILNFI